MNIRIDPEFKSLIPPLTSDELSQLTENVKRDGCRDPLVVWGDDNILLDGHNRLKICQSSDIEYSTIKIELADRNAAKIWIIENQFGRRSLSAFTRGELALSMKAIVAEQARERQIKNEGGRGKKKNLVQNSSQGLEDNKTRTILAKQAGVSHDTLKKIEILVEKAPEEVKAKLRAGEETINGAYNNIKNPNSSNTPGYDGDEWYTPEEHIQLVKDVIGEIDLDPASCEYAQKTIQAKKYYTKEDDGLSKEWRGSVYLNPPYSNPLISKFTSKLINEYRSGNVTEAILLVNNCTDSSWFHSLLDYSPCCFTRGRVSLKNPAYGTFQTRQGQAFFYLGPNKDRFAEVFSKPEIGKVLWDYKNKKSMSEA